MSMGSPKPWTVLFSLVVARHLTDQEVPSETPCQGCGEPLSIHQPDINAPERLLGTCDTCGAWHLVDLDRAVTVLLPDQDALGNVEVVR